MLAYAANRPDPAGRRSSPNMMLFIVAAHIAAIAALMSAKMDLPKRILDRTTVIDVPADPPPPRPDEMKRVNQPHHRVELATQPESRVHTDTAAEQTVETGENPIVDTDPVIGPVVDPTPYIPPKPTLQPVRTGPRLLTPASQLRPPYPESKLLNEEEAVLRLRLTISADGRVTSVEPVGQVDAVFLQAARRYLIAHWRYSPATLDGRAMVSTNDITLSFRLDS